MKATMKKMFAMALALCLALCCLTACGKADKGDVLTVATSPDFAPMEFVDVSKTGQDQYVGFDISLAKYIADELGMTLEIKPMSFDACQTAVSTGSVDLAISGFSWKEDRAENYNLSDYYYAGDNEVEQVVITLKENEGKYTTADSMAGMDVAAQTASLQEELCQNQLTGSNLIVVGDLTTALMQLKNGDFPFLAVAKGQADVFIANDPDVALSGFSFEVDPKYVGNVVMLQKGNDEMTQKVNDILAKAYDEGLYATWYADAQVAAGTADAQEVSFDDEGNAG